MRNPKDNRNNKKKIVRIIIAIMIIGMITVLYANRKEPKEEISSITYDKMITYVRNEEVARIEALQESKEVTLTMRDGIKKKALISSLDEFSSFISKEIQEGAKIEFEIISPQEKLKIDLYLMISLFTLILMVFILYTLTSSNYTVVEAKSNKKFDDVAGIDEEKEQLEEIIEFLKNPQKYESIGAKIPKGILLEGEPGTGKTLLAKAIAGEANVPFFQVNGSSFEEKFVGVGASRVRKLFKQAKKAAPSIVFIDELDSVAQSRYTQKSYSEQTLNQLLAEMDGFDSSNNVIVIAATNHIQVLDSAITRPGRFDRHIHIPIPDVNAREKILETHARNKKLGEDISLKELAKKTVGFTGADLENVLNEAAIYAVNQKRESISQADVDEAIVRVLVGLEKKNVAITQEDKWLTAVHESGHAIISAILRPEVKNLGISIVQRGRAGGYNLFDEADTKYCKRQDMYKQVKVSYAGRAAEEVILGDVSTGASNDLEEASRKVHLMITRFAMNGNLLVKVKNENNYNEQLDVEGIKEAEKICKSIYEDTIKLVKVHKEQIIKLAELLIEKEYLSQEQIIKFLKETL